MAMRCLSPPDNSVGLRVVKPESPTRSRALSTRLTLLRIKVEAR